MANDISANPWRLDTAGVAIIYAFPVKIVNVIWANFAAAGNVLLLQDVNGKDIINCTIVTGFSTQMAFGTIGWVRGIKLTTLSAGEITISIGAGK